MPVTMKKLQINKICHFLYEISLIFYMRGSGMNEGNNCFNMLRIRSNIHFLTQFRQKDHETNFYGDGILRYMK